jgi:NAD+ kinase
LKRLSKSIQRVAIVANSGKVNSRDVVRKAAKLIARSGRDVLTDAATAKLVGLTAPTFPDAASLTREVDLVLVFGGDGTMLRVARETAGSRTPLLGINVGALGFLTDVPSWDLPHALRQVWNGDFRLESRALIEASVDCRGQGSRTIALNEFVISRHMVSRLIELEASVDGEILTRYRGDGLIISSPTGSTAYSLAAGGAVVYPTAEVFTLTPICPHTLSNRSVIVNLSSTIRVKIISQKPEAVFSGDGQDDRRLNAGDRVTIRRSRHSVRLIHLTGTSFFETLRHKLNWSGTNVPVK